jgi:hypothetical protein
LTVLYFIQQKHCLAAAAAVAATVVAAVVAAAAAAAKAAAAEQKNDDQNDPRAVATIIAHIEKPPYLLLQSSILRSLSLCEWFFTVFSTCAVFISDS